MSTARTAQLSPARLFSITPVRLLVAGVCLAALSSIGHAQHMMHGSGGESIIDVETMPHDDAVLPESPARIMLDFEESVRLVKLTLRTAESRELLDIGFRYDPATGTMFSHDLPMLAEAPYYIADWAVVNDDERVIHGTFHFSFGPDARPPSEIMPEMEAMRHIMAPDYRLQDPEVEFRIRE